MLLKLFPLEAAPTQMKAMQKVQGQNRFFKTTLMFSSRSMQTATRDVNFVVSGMMMDEIWGPLP